MIGPFFFILKYLYYHIRFIISQTTVLVGGQAVIEGVMMRVPGAYATAVRDNKNVIHVKRIDFISISEKYTFLNKLKKEIR